ncbi:MAG: FG-GAP-like repeat-containing protein [Gemmatimonadales bacterium]
MLALFAAGIVASPGAALAQAPAAVSDAQRQLNAGHADSAVATLEAFYAATPQATIGRLLLGNAYRQLGRLDRALAAYAAVTAPRPARLQAWFHTAAIQTERGETDAAFATLERLKASGAFDMDLVTGGEQFRELRADRRFAGLGFRPADFERPFVEPVRVIHEWVGEAKGDQYSWIARGIGDVDGDRATDIVTSAPTFGSGGGPTGPGKVYVYSGRSGKELWAATGQPGDNLGTGLEGAGDVDGDGVGDVIAGAPGNDRAYVYSGRTGAILHTLVSPDSGVQFGQAAAGAGDQNGDGRADLIVGAPGASAKGPGTGAAFVFSGKDGSLIVRLDGDSAGHAFGSIVAGDKWGRRTPVLVGAPGGGPGNRGRVYVFEYAKGKRKFTIDAGESGVALGAMFTSIVGDVNGDRVPDVYAADFSDGGRGPGAGRVYVRSGRDGRELLTLSGEQPGDGFGIGSAEAGDVNGDGHDDLVVGAWQYAGAAQSGGKVYVYSGKDGTLLREITGRVPGETFGFDATGVGDVDGDGVVDLLLTSTWSNIKGFRTGRMFVISGR